MNIYIEQLQKISYLLNAYVIIMSLSNNSDYMIIESMLKQAEEIKDMIES